MSCKGRCMMGAFALLLAGLPALGQSHSDKEFLENSSQGNVAEVELAKLALQKTHNAQVRAFAQRMIHDHEMLARQMKPFAMQAGVQPSTSLDREHQDIYDRLKGLSGPAFDKEYVEDMDKDHHKDLKSFQEEIASTQDMKLKQAVESGEKVIAEHTRLIDGISRKMGMTPAGA